MLVFPQTASERTVLRSHLRVLPVLSLGVLGGINAEKVVRGERELAFS